MTPNNITCYRYQPLGVWSTAYPSWSQCGLLDHYQCVPCGSNRNACGTVTWKASPILLTVVQDVVTTAWNDLGHWLRSSQHWQKTRVSPTCKFQGNFFWCRTANKNVTLFKLPYKPIQIFFSSIRTASDHPIFQGVSRKPVLNIHGWVWKWVISPKLLFHSDNGAKPLGFSFLP
jgi:hypothetical protein